ncbi:MAG TPA: serine/threonine-protein kinase [Polyangia bacterium]|nr:serine/threonine-protein kinase [Polyangia bacterium]
MIEEANLPFAAGTGSSPGEVTVGQTLGKYEILQRLAAGGMAEIFLARTVGVLGFDKLVVIKRILPHLASRNDFIEMFLDEARIATTLGHANIVQTHEVGVHGKSYFMAMEYLAGEDVRTIVRHVGRDGGKMPIEHALSIGIGVAAGLHYAHEKRDRDKKPLDIVHRDVTPQNVIVTYDGAVKLLDFGIAKASNRMNETRSGSFKGKVPYMSPEQCRGEAMDRRTDIFSLGILLYEMTLGRRLFAGDTDFQILKQIVEGQVKPPHEIDPSYDKRLSAIVMKALAPDPKQRFATARELQVALDELAHDLRLRLSPIALADYMHRLFGDKIENWERAAADGDVAKLEAHFATVLAEREADIAAEEAQPLVPVGSRPKSDVQMVELEFLPDEDLRPASHLGRWLGAAALVAVMIVGAWALHGRGDGAVAHAAVVAAPIATAASTTATAKTSAPAPSAAVAPAPPIAQRDVPPPAGASATVEVVTAPPGAALVLDGTTLPEQSPARLTVTPGVAHTLSVHTAGHPGVSQRFQLDAGEEATIEIDLRRAAAHAAAAAIKHGTTAANGGGAKGAHAAAATIPATIPLVAPAPVAPKGDGNLVLASSPWCNVTVDGQARGTTPLNLKLKAGNHEVVLANPEFKIKRTLAVDIEPNQTVRKSLDFAPE